MNFNAGEDTFFKVKKFLNCRGRILELSTPKIMGIMNLTPDSFYDGGIIQNEDQMISIAGSMLNAGVDIIDIGGQSTRPKAKRISPEEEWNRIEPAIKSIHKNFPEAIISVDTFYSEVAAKAIDNGVSIINDISGGEFDSEMFATIAQKQVPYVLMHIQGTPETMQENPHYENVVDEVLNYFIEKISLLKKLGVHDIIIDPGFGFGKKIEHNYSLLRNLHLFKMLNCPILIGLSRKSMVTKVLNVKAEEALNGTIALNTIALLNGASILRVHDVKEAVEVRRIVNEYNS